MQETSYCCLMCFFYSYSQFSTVSVECTVSSTVQSYHNSNLIFHLGTAFKIRSKNPRIQWCCHQLLYWSILECLWQLVQILGTIFKKTSSKSSFKKPDNIVFSTLQVKPILIIFKLSSKSFTFDNPYYVPQNFGFNVLQV